MNTATKDEMQMNKDTNDCFVHVLSRLKESSSDAVESSDKTNDFTQYMHVDRPVQDEFDKIIRKAAETDKAELVLLCGSVGDGKSHMLSYYNSNHSELMSKFFIHNDSTASLFKDKPAIYTLRQILEDFSDGKIGMSQKKAIIAINLGTLNNFLDEYGDNEFTLLKKYISQTGVLENEIPQCPEEEDGFFHSISFSDYHLYDLTEHGPKSQYIDSLITKIIDDAEKNVIYSEYKRCCEKCASSKICPVKINYELFMNETVRGEIIQIIIETIVKNKLIISTRALLNLIYEMLVDERYIDIGSFEPRKKIGNLSELDYCKALLPNSVFSRENSSIAINSFQSIDPINVRTDSIDKFVVYYTNNNRVISLFQGKLPEFSKALEKLSDFEFEQESGQKLKVEVLKLLIRASRLFGKYEEFETIDADYQEYMRCLYYWNRGQKSRLKDVFALVKKGALSWNGDADDNYMQILTGRRQTKYSVIQDVKIKRTFSGLEDKNVDILVKFNNAMILKYKNEKTEEQAEIDVDFALYELLVKMSNGYHPNMKDKRINVKFNNFVDKISRYGNKNECVYIKEKLLEGEKMYRLEYNDEDDEYTFEEI